MATQVINVQLLSACPDVNNFTILDCNGVTISSGWSTAQLLAGITCSATDVCTGGGQYVTITSNTFLCNNSIDVPFSSSSVPATASFTYTYYNGGTFSFDLDQSVGTGITVSYAIMSNYSITCTFGGYGDGLTSSGNLPSGNTNLKIRGLNAIDCLFDKYKRGSTMSIITNQHPNGISLANNGTFSAGITVVTLKIDSTTCETYIC